MKSLDENYYNPFFSHIYVEEEIAEHPRVKQILARFMKAEIVYIRPKMYSADADRTMKNNIMRRT